MSLGFFGLGCTTKGEHHVIRSLFDDVVLLEFFESFLEWLC